MTEYVKFSACDVALLRTPLLPAGRAADCRFDKDSRVDEGDDPLSKADLLSNHVRRLCRDPLFREAVAVSSRSLDALLDKLDNGSRIEPARLRRAALSLTRYLLRATARPTPYGLFAGVSPARFDDGPSKVRVGADHRKGVRPDSQWLSDVVSRWERDTRIMPHLRVVSNELCLRRGDRLVLPSVRAGSSQTDMLAREVSIRRTPVVEEILRRARTPVAGEEIMSALASAFPAASAEAIERTMRTLIELDVLLTDLRPPPTSDDPGMYVWRRLVEISAAAPPPGLCDFAEVLGALDEYASRPLGGGREALAVAESRMRRFQPGERLVQVDVRRDVDVRLPRGVSEEIERAAGVLWRLCPPGASSPQLRAYHEAFLERYGYAQLVPIHDLVDSERGLGPPDGHRSPDRRRPAYPDVSRPEATGKLAALVQETTLAGRDEIVLTEELLQHLTSEKDEAPPPTVDFAVRVMADSVKALDDGDFMLSVVNTVSRGGAYFGRFAYLLDELRDSLADVGDKTGKDTGAVPAQLAFQPRLERLNNVTRVSRLLSRMVTVGLYADSNDADTLRSDDLAVGADSQRLYLVSRKLGREVSAVRMNMLDLQRRVSAVARLIDEISASGRGLWQRWNWGQTGMVLPYTPRLRTGRTVLAPESWIPDARLVDKRLSWREWRERFSAWRDRWRVPDKASVVFADHQLPLDLTDALHLRILRDELQSSSHVRLHEQLEGGHGWLEGYANEIVVPLAASGSPTQLSPPVAPARSIDVSHRPGGEWLSLNLYADSERHDEILAGNVAAVVRRLSDAADRWFFVRYFDAGSHLRLRFRRKRAKDLADMLSIVNDWGTRLCDDGLAKDFSIVTYRPEIHRYGGPEAIAKAEKLFHADSVAVLEQLALRRQGLDVEAEILCAAELVDMARLFDPVGWEGRVLQIYRERTRYREYRARQRELLDLIDPEGDWPALRISPARLSVLAAWAARARAVADYGVHIRRLEKTGALWTSANGVLASTFHMHVNRSLGIDPEREQKVYAVVSAVTRARQTRRKHLQNE